MKLFKVERTDLYSYDDYDSFVCITPTEEAARWMAPDPEYHMWKDGVWCYSYGEQGPASTDFTGWVRDPNTLKVTELGVANSDESEVILASFNAG